METLDYTDAQSVASIISQFYRAFITNSGDQSMDTVTDMILDAMVNLLLWNHYREPSQPVERALITGFANLSEIALEYSGEKL